MTCIVFGSLVEMWDPATSGVFLEFVEHVQSGQFIAPATPHLRPQRVAHVVLQKTPGVIPLYNLRGMRAVGRQWTWSCGLWTRLSDHVQPTAQPCKGLAALILEGRAGAVKVDGVVCATHGTDNVATEDGGKQQCGYADVELREPCVPYWNGFV
jgi:hypothetical protein